MKVAVYLGSRPGCSPDFCENARETGRLFAQNGIEVVYGGAKVGSMGALFEGVREGNGKVIGVFPKNFKGRKEYAKKGLEIFQDGEGYEGYKVIESADLDERIRIIEGLVDVCVLLPGSYGSMHEFFSFFEGKVLGTINKPLAILNLNGYYNALLELIKTMQDAGFSNSGDLQSLIVADNPADLVSAIAALK
jgi:hypothetical protein